MCGVESVDLRNGRAAGNESHPESFHVVRWPTQKAIEAVVPSRLRKGQARPPDKLITFLKVSFNGESKGRVSLAARLVPQSYSPIKITLHNAEHF